MVLLARGDLVTLADLPDFLQPPVPQFETRELSFAAEDGMSLAEMEKALILSALRKFGGNQSNAARYLKITRKILLNRIARYGIEKSDTQSHAATHG